LADDTITAVPENSKVFLITKEQKIKSEEWDVILERIKAIEIPDDGRVMIKADKTQLNIVVIGYKSRFFPE
jgi:hypothetical protein